MNELDQHKVDHVILIIHGIRDRGGWQHMVSAELSDSTTIAIPIKYGRFDAMQFLFPRLANLIAWVTNEPTPIVRVEREMRTAIAQFKDAKISVIAHSFGTHLLSRLLQDQTDLRIWRIALCGSVVKQSFRWDTVKERVGDRADDAKRNYIVNDCGSGDIWPAVAEMLSFGYGAAGTDGFGSSLVEDRYHTGKHSVFLEPEFVRRYWVPFFREGQIEPGSGKQGIDLCPCFGILRFALSKPMLLIWSLLALVIIAVAFLLSRDPTKYEEVNVNFTDFLASHVAARESGDFETLEEQYLNRSVDWKCEIARVVEKDQYYLVKPIDHDPIRQEVSLYFEDTGQGFDKFLSPGKRLQIKAVIDYIGDRSIILREGSLLKRLPDKSD